MTIHAGQLDRRVTVIRRKEIGRDRANKPFYVEGVVADIFAKFEDEGSVESFDNTTKQRAATRRSKFTIRHLPVIETDRIYDGDRTWNVVGIREIGRREGIEIAAELIK